MEEKYIESILNNFKYRQMKYSPHQNREVLANGKYKGYQFYILNLGSFPTAYIEIPQGHKLYFIPYDNIDLDVHGGLTYSERNLWTTSTEEIKNSWFIGWDYAHYGDYLGYEEMYPVDMQTHGKKWTTEEIVKEVFEAINQLERKNYEN